MEGVACAIQYHPSRNVYNFKVPEFATTSVLDRHQNHYCNFGLPYGPGVFIGNARLRNCVAALNSVVRDDVASVEKHLHKKLRICQSLSFVYEDLEVEEGDDNISEMFLAVTRKFYCHNSTSAANYSALSSLKTNEIRLGWYQFTLVTSSVVDVEDSAFKTFQQLLINCGDAAIHMQSCGVPLDDCVVLGLSLYGLNQVEVCAVYLLPNSWPVLCRLSGPIDYSTPDGLTLLSKWLVVIANFCKEMVTAINSFTSVQPSEPLCASLAVSRLFFKPPPHFAHSWQLTQYSLRLYDKLAAVEGATDVVCFPLGWINYGRGCQSKVLQGMLRKCMSQYFTNRLPEDDCPLLVFPLLEGYTNDRPEKEEDVTEYLIALQQVVCVFNQAEVAHMDLRPNNLMWKRDEVSGRLLMKVIDLEDGLQFGDSLMDELVKEYRWDLRYPVCNGANPASELCNQFYAFSIRLWLSDGENLKYDEFMRRAGGKVVRTELAMEYPFDK